jgi:hypothetical protein
MTINRIYVKNIDNNGKRYTIMERGDKNRLSNSIVHRYAVVYKQDELEYFKSIQEAEKYIKEL